MLGTEGMMLCCVPPPQTSVAAGAGHGQRAVPPPVLTLHTPALHPPRHTRPHTRHAPQPHPQLGAGHGRQRGCSTPKTQLCPPTLMCLSRAQLSVPCAAFPAQVKGVPGTALEPRSPCSCPPACRRWRLGGRPAPRFPCPLPTPAWLPHPPLLGPPGGSGDSGAFSCGWLSPSLFND